jgi:hypothetical protein
LFGCRQHDLAVEALGVYVLFLMLELATKSMLSFPTPCTSNTIGLAGSNGKVTDLLVPWPGPAIQSFTILDHMQSRELPYYLVKWHTIIFLMQNMMPETRRSLPGVMLSCGWRKVSDTLIYPLLWWGHPIILLCPRPLTLNIFT